MRILLGLAILAVVLAAAALVIAHEPEIPPVDLRAAVQPDPALLEKGARLAAVGNCRGCHTTAEGLPLAGGMPMHSPFGVIYSTNISPDRETGIGKWSEAAFQRAMRHGIARDGHHLYPAFPYERYTRVTDEDNRAIYAWLMSQPPVRYVPPKNKLPFPFNVRAGLKFWKMAFLEPGPYMRPNPADARGDYLVDSLGHCGACHSPRNLAYAEKMGEELSGGDAEGWHAYAIQAASKAVKPWTAEELASYLQTGFHPQHGVSRGTMGLVTSELAFADRADVEAIARAIVARMQPGVAGKQVWAEAVARQPLAPKGVLLEGEAATIYKTSCESCHDGKRRLPFGGMPLSLSTGLSGESPRNLINVIVHGLQPSGNGATTPVMPGYAGALSDAQIEALVAWLRANLTNQPPWDGIPKLIAESRKMEPSMLLFPPGGSGATP